MRTGSEVMGDVAVHYQMSSDKVVRFTNNK